MNPDPNPNHPQGNAFLRRGAKGCIAPGAIATLLTIIAVVFLVVSIGKKEPSTEDPPIISGPIPDQQPLLDPDPPALPDYTLTVKNGSESGKFAEGAKISISADVPSSAQIFLNWTTDKGGVFLDDKKMQTTFTMPGNAVVVMANYESVDSRFGGQFLSERKRTKYEIDSEKKRFSFYTLIEGRFLLQTEISPYQVSRVDETGSVIEISGKDNRAGVGPSTSVRLEKVSESEFNLERIEPIGGDLGLFRALPRPVYPGKETSGLKQ